MKLIDRLRELQQHLREIGFGLSTLALPAPKLLLLPSSQDEQSKEEILFSQLVTEPEISNVCSDLFESGFYNQAVTEAFKALNKFVQKKSGRKDVSDSSLMNLVFSEKDPILYWSARSSTSEKDEQKGYMFLYAGGFTGIRNPCAHEIGWIDDHQSALDAILFAQHLIRKAKKASVTPKPH
ncbi:TIGR02391 family protein [Sphingopyxis panaciterrae]